MKKLKLSALKDNGVEVLTREQMKNVLGKMVGGSGDGYELEYMGCSITDGIVSCDYIATYGDGRKRELCGFQCEPGDGGDCMV